MLFIGLRGRRNQAGILIAPSPVGFWGGGRFKTSDAVPFIVAQKAGAHRGSCRTLCVLLRANLQSGNFPAGLRPNTLKFSPHLKYSPHIVLPDRKPRPLFLPFSYVIIGAPHSERCSGSVSPEIPIGWGRTLYSPLPDDPGHQNVFNPSGAKPPVLRCLKAEPTIAQLWS